MAIRKSACSSCESQGWLLTRVSFRCDLSDLVVPAIGLFPDKPSAITDSEQEVMMHTYDDEQPSPESSTDLTRTSALPTVSCIDGS